MNRRELLTRLAWLPFLGPALHKLATTSSVLHGVKAMVPPQTVFDLVRTVLTRMAQHQARVVEGFRFVWYKDAITNPEKIRITNGWLGYWEKVGGPNHGHVAAWVDAWGVHVTPVVKMTESQWWQAGRHVTQSQHSYSIGLGAAAKRLLGATGWAPGRPWVTP